MKKWIGAAVALLFFVGLLAFLLPILGWQKPVSYTHLTLPTKLEV